MKHIEYLNLKPILNIKDEYRTKFRGQSASERSKLKEGLLYHKRILDPLRLKLTQTGYTLVDGHHRWLLLPEVFAECPEFSTQIPVVIIKGEDVDRVMLFTQLGRRNLTASEISQYVDLLITEDGLSANKAYKQVAEMTGKSKSTIQRIHQPTLAEVERERQLHSDKKLPKLGNFSPESTETSLDTPQYDTLKQIRKHEYLQDNMKSTSTFTPSKRKKSTSKADLIEREFAEVDEYFNSVSATTGGRESTVGDLAKAQEDATKAESLEYIVCLLEKQRAAIVDLDLALDTINLSKAIIQYKDEVKRLKQEVEVQV